MISNLALIDNKSVRALAQAIYDRIEEVIEVRFFPAVRPELKRVAGDTAVIFSAFIFSNSEYFKFFATVPEDVYSDETKHQLIVDQIAGKINNFKQTGVRPNKPEVPGEIIPGDE